MPSTLQLDAPTLARRMHADSVGLSIATLGDDQRTVLRETSRLIDTLGRLLEARGIGFEARLRVLEPDKL